MDANPEKEQPKRRRFNAERGRRLRMEALNGVLARKRCGHCATEGAWKVYDVDRTTGRTRYIKCLACGHCDQAPVIVKEIADEK